MQEILEVSELLFEDILSWKRTVMCYPIEESSEVVPLVKRSVCRALGYGCVGILKCIKQRMDRVLGFRPLGSERVKKAI